MKGHKPKEKSPTPTLVDVYCGAGGNAEGFRQEGFKILCGIDNWEPAAKTFEFNHNAPCKQIDVLELTKTVESIESIPDSTVLTGSPPCISFSSSNKSGKANKNLGKKLTRAFLKIVVVKKFKPNSELKAWFMENVGKSSSHVKSFYTFKQLGLKDWAKQIGRAENEIAIRIKDNSVILNSADFGSPQMRKRLFVGEIIGEINFQFPTPTHSSGPSDKTELYNTFGKVRSLLPSPYLEKTELRESYVDPNYPTIRVSASTLTDHFYDTGLRQQLWERSKYLKTNHPYMGKMSFPENQNRPCRTIMANSIGSSRESIIVESEIERPGDGQFRALTVRESACFMGFPITYQFLGNVFNKIRLVGNAVCPHVSRALAQHVKKSIGEKTCKNPKVTGKIKGLEKIVNLNTFERKLFPLAKPDSKTRKFRMHLFKDGNMTVALANYNLLRAKTKVSREWKTFVLYSIGEGYLKKAHEIPVNGYNDLAPIIIDNLSDGQQFIKILNNGFSEKIAPSNVLQALLEKKINSSEFHTPAELMTQINQLIYSHKDIDMLVTDSRMPFKKQSIPLKQIMALYALNKVITVANNNGKTFGKALSSK